MVYNELDNITVELNEKCIIFKKPAETVDPMSVNIETLTKIVRKEFQKQHDQQIQYLKGRIDEPEDMISDIDDLDERMNEIEAKFSETDS